MKYFVGLFLAFLLAAPVWSWTAEGHILVADLAVDGLSAEQTRKLEKIARTLETTFETDERLYLLKTFGSASDLAKIASFPDRVRDIPLKDLFARWNLPVPAPLSAFSEMDTSKWHYQNQSYYSGADEAPVCEIGDPVNVAAVIPLLLESYSTVNDDVSRAILLAFIMHMVADAHQPLHGISRVDNQCNSDLGGNQFCATELGYANRCDVTLHALWDGAVGLFDRYDTYPELYKAVRGQQAKGPEVEDLIPQHWLDEDLTDARFIYTIRLNRNPDDKYIADGQYIAYSRLMLASARLGLILKELR